MNAAQQQIAAIGAWLAESSKPCPAPLSGFIAKGPYAVLVPSVLDAVPSPNFDAEALPLFIPQAQAPDNLPTIDTTTPASQDRASDRLGHLLWLMDDGRLPGVAVVGLENPAEPLQVAIDRAGMGALDLTVTPLLCAPLWAMPANSREMLALRLPRWP